MRNRIQQSELGGYHAKTPDTPDQEGFLATCGLKLQRLGRTD